MDGKRTKAFLLFLMMNTTNIIVSGVNLALEKHTRQSGTDDGFTNGPEYAVNGNWTEYLNSRFKCTHSKYNEYQPWWTVDLGATFNVSNVVIYNRQDSCCSPWLNNYDIDVFEKPPCVSDKWATFSRGRQSRCHFQASSVVYLNATCQEGTIGRFVRLRLRGIGTLCLCEVEVYGSLISNSTGSSTSRSACGFLNTEYSGIDLATTAARSSIHCINMCITTGGCCAAVYDEETSMCTLKRKVNNDETTSHSLLGNSSKTSWLI